MRELRFGLVVLLFLGILMFSVKRLQFNGKPVQEPPAVIIPQRQIFVRNGSKVEKMNLEEYITGAVCGEMPDWFEMEALKAQAVAARTFALKANASGGKHGDGSVCMDAACCQAYRTPGEEAESIRQAVAETAGQVLKYRGELIDAVYFSCSGGSTENAVAVWGQDVPYLQSVDSPGEEKAGAYFSEQRLTRDELEKTLMVELSNDPEYWFCDPVYTEGGGVSTVKIGGKEWTGVELRQLLSLHSTRFRVFPSDNAVVIAAYGYGHRVGMSQYGANAMAADGANYREILAHYYTGTEVSVYP